MTKAIHKDMYKKFFKLKGKPFGLSPEPKYFFNSASHKQAFQCIGTGLEQKQGIITISGDPGTGKTTLMLGLQHMLSKTSVEIACIQNTILPIEDMLRYVVAEFGLPYEGCSKVALLKALETFFKNCKSSKKRAVILIDEAHNLTESAVEELRMMLNLFKGKTPLLQFVLFGQLRFNEKASSTVMDPLLQKIIATSHLNNLDHGETRAYINHRLRTAGWNGDPQFTTDAYTSIYDYSLGNPAEINMLCLQLLETARVLESHKIDRALVDWIIEELHNRNSDVNFTGTILEELVNNYFSGGVIEEEPVPEDVLEDDSLNIQQQLKNTMTEYEQEKTDNEKEEDIQNWLSRKEEDYDDNIDTDTVQDSFEETMEILHQLKTSDTDNPFQVPDAPLKEDFEEVIY